MDGETTKRVCSHCGASMLSGPTERGRKWECTTCYNTVTEIGGVPGSGGGLSISFETETGPRDLITDKQRKFLADLGETTVPRFKDDASERLDTLIGCFDSWLAACFRSRFVLHRPEQRRLEIALHKADLRQKYPKYGGDLTAQHRFELQKFVLDALGPDLFLHMSPKDITKNAEALGLPPRPQKAVFIVFNCSRCAQKYEAPEEMADTVLDCQKCGERLRIPRPSQGHYAAPTEPQLEDAELYGVEVRPGMHRGELKELLATAAKDPARTPSVAAYAHYRQRKTDRQNRLPSVR